MCNKKILIPIASWTILGFKRGWDEYDYSYRKYNDYNKNGKKKTYIYTSKIALGLVGFIFYINPFCLPLSVTREIYRLEVNLRGLEDEKNTDRYNCVY